MKNTELGSTSTNPDKGQLPSEVREAIVQCEGYTCWARKNAKHEWIDWYGQKLTVLEIVTALA